MKFLNVPLLSGFLSTQTKAGLNLINAPAFAKEVGLTVEFAQKPGEPALEVSVGPYTVLGTSFITKFSPFLKFDYIVASLPPNRFVYDFNNFSQ